MKYIISKLFFICNQLDLFFFPEMNRIKKGKRLSIF